MQSLNRPYSSDQSLASRDLPVFTEVFEPVSESSSKLLNYARIILSGWKAVLLSGIALLAIAVLVRSLLPLRYTGRTVLEVRSPNERFLNREAFDPRSMNSAIGAEFYLQTQLQIIDSDQLIRNVVKRLSKSPEGLAAVAAHLRLSEADLLASEGRMVERMRKTVKSKVLPQTRLIEIVTTSTDARYAATLANAFASQFLEEEATAQRAALTETRETLSREIENVRARLDQSQNDLNRFLRSSGLLIGARNENIQEGQLVQTQTELSVAQADRIRAQSRYEQIAKGGAQSLPDVLNDTTLKDYRNNLANLKRELAELSTTLSPKNYRIVKVKAQIESLEKESAAYEARILSKITNEFEAASRRENLLTGAYRESSATFADQTSKGFSYTRLKGEMETNRHMYESMLAKLKETEVIAAIGASNLRVVDQAYPAVKPNAPNLLQAGVLGLMGGLILGGAATIGRHSALKTFREMADVVAFLRVPSIRVGRAGQAPISRKGTADVANWSSAALESYAAVVASIQTGERSTVDMRSSGLEWNQPASGCFVVSSPGPGDGKTITTAGLGVAMARNGKRVLLINGDLVNPRLHEVFEADNSVGLADLLVEGDLTNLMNFVRPTPVRGLSLLPGGPAVGEAMQLFDNPLLPHLLNRLRHHFDLILIDTPPLLQAADARLLARHADGVILVIRSEHTGRVDAVAARQRLASFGLKLAGVVLNDSRRVIKGYVSSRGAA